MSKTINNSGLNGSFKNFTVDLNEELASQLSKFALDSGAPPEVLAAAILTSHVEKGSLDISDLRDS